MGEKAPLFCVSLVLLAVTLWSSAFRAVNASIVHLYQHDICTCTRLCIQSCFNSVVVFYSSLGTSPGRKIMHTALCEQYGMDIPLFAFSHSPAVVAAVSTAGGFRLPAASCSEPGELAKALTRAPQACAANPSGHDPAHPPRH